MLELAFQSASSVRAVCSTNFALRPDFFEFEIRPFSSLESVQTILGKLPFDLKTKNSRPTNSIVSLTFVMLISFENFPFNERKSIIRSIRT